MYDFKIQNYSVQDLERLFQLTPNQYTKKDIIERKQDFFEKIANATTAKHENPKLIQNLTTFLDEAYRLLVYFLHDPDPNFDSTPSTQQNQTRIPDPRPLAPPLHEGQQRNTPQYEYQMNRDPSTSHSIKHLDQKYRYDTEKYDRAKAEIIIPPEKPFKTVMQNEFNPGIINPIHTPILTKCLNIDTRFRDDLYRTKSTDFIFTLPDRIRKVVSMRLSAYEFPVSNIYNISESYGNHYLNILCSYVPPPLPPTSTQYARTTIRTIIIPDGTYNIQMLLQEINQQLQPRDPSTNDLVNTQPDDLGMFNCIQFNPLPDQETGKTQIETTDPSDFPYKSQIVAIGFDFTLNINREKDLTDIKTKMGWNLGFIKPKYYDQTSYISDTPSNMDTIKYIYLMVNDFNNSVNNNFFIGAFPKYVLNKNILARIPVTTQNSETTITKYQQENQLTQHMEPRRYFGPVDIQRLQIQIYDEFGRILDINQSNYSICLTFQCMYD